jgi:hypothetical protein
VASGSGCLSMFSRLNTRHYSPLSSIKSLTAECDRLPSRRRSWPSVALPDFRRKTR